MHPDNFGRGSYPIKPSFSMNIEQAQQLRKKFLYLEGLIAWSTQEYIWKVIIGPEDRRYMDRFRDSVDPSIPLNPLAILQPFWLEELTVYFFLKTKGNLICREYREFLSANDMRVDGVDYAIASFLLVD
jgi:hypothetical protein